MKKFLSFLSLVLSIQVFAQKNNYNEVLINKDIKSKIDIIAESSELCDSVDLEMVISEVDFYKNNLEELKRINKELDLVLGKTTGTICTT